MPGLLAERLVKGSATDAPFLTSRLHMQTDGAEPTTSSGTDVWNAQCQCRRCSLIVNQLPSMASDPPLVGFERRPPAILIRSVLT
jgi:hypothetical protein